MNLRSVVVWSKARWYVLSEQTADRHADPAQVVVGLYQFFHKNHLKRYRPGLKAMQFVRLMLDRAGLGGRIEWMPYGQKRYRIPPRESSPPEQLGAMTR